MGGTATFAGVGGGGREGSSGAMAAGDVKWLVGTQEREGRRDEVGGTGWDRGRGRYPRSRA